MPRARRRECPSCGSVSFSPSNTRPKQRGHLRIKGWRCSDCGHRAWSGEFWIVGDYLAEIAEGLSDASRERLVLSAEPPANRRVPLRPLERIEAEGLSPLAYFREDARRRGLSIRQYEKEAGILLMPAQKQLVEHETHGAIVDLIISGSTDTGNKIA